MTTYTTSGKIWADDPATGKRRDLAVEEDLAFWAWAAVEVLRMTGVRVEELLEISHHSLVQYRLPPLVSSFPCCRSSRRRPIPNDSWSSARSWRRAVGDHPPDPRRRRNSALVRAYDRRECLWIGPAPLLFQRRFGADNRRLCDSTIRNMLNAAWPAPA